MLKSTAKPIATFEEANGHCFLLSGKDIEYINAQVASTFLVGAKSSDVTSDDDAMALFLVDKHELGISVKVKTAVKYRKHLLVECTFFRATPTLRHQFRSVTCA